MISFEREFDAHKKYFSGEGMFNNCLLEVGNPGSPFLGTVAVYSFDSEHEARYAAEMVQNILRAVDVCLKELETQDFVLHFFDELTGEEFDSAHEKNMTALLTAARAPMTEISA